MQSAFRPCKRPRHPLPNNPVKKKQIQLHAHNPCPSAFRPHERPRHPLPNNPVKKKRIKPAQQILAKEVILKHIRTIKAKKKSKNKQTLEAALWNFAFTCLVLNEDTHYANLKTLINNLQQDAPPNLKKEELLSLLELDYSLMPGTAFLTNEAALNILKFSNILGFQENRERYKEGAGEEDPGKPIIKIDGKRFYCQKDTSSRNGEGNTKKCKKVIFLPVPSNNINFIEIKGAGEEVPQKPIKNMKMANVKQYIKSKLELENLLRELIICDRLKGTPGVITPKEVFAYISYKKMGIVKVSMIMDLGEQVNPFKLGTDDLTELARAIKELHERGIVHGDLKAGNIVRSNNDKKLKLIDFGLSIPFTTQNSHEKFIFSTTIGGTYPSRSVLKYRADLESLPTDFKELKKIYMNEDVFAFGCILLEKNEIHAYEDLRKELNMTFKKFNSTDSNNDTTTGNELSLDFKNTAFERLKTRMLVQLETLTNNFRKTVYEKLNGNEQNTDQRSLILACLGIKNEDEWLEDRNKLSIDDVIKKLETLSRSSAQPFRYSLQ